MPTRPEQHRSEDSSRRAFEALLPEEWVYRQLSHDYGIDGEVEIFSDEETTGLIFKVQLKGTRRDVRTVRFSHDKAKYYASLSVPVLIVLHHGPSGRVFARWFQSYDPHSEPSTERSMALVFRDEDELTPAAMGRLLRDMEIHRLLSNPATALPLELTVDQRDESIAGLPSASVTMSLRDASRNFPDAFRIVGSEGPGTMGNIIIRRGSVTISLRGLVTSTVHYLDPWPADPDPKLVLNDVLVMLGVLINRLGLYDVAARLFADHAIGSSVIQNEQTIAIVAGSMTRTHRIEDAIRVLEGITGTDAFERMLLAISLTWTGMSNLLTEREREAVVEYLVREAERYESSGDARQAAIGYYNLANRLRVFGKHQQALDYYTRAGELDPTYEGRAYFSGDIAGSLFEAGRISGSGS